MSGSAARRARAAEEKARRKLEKEDVVLEFQYETPGLLRYQGPIILTDLTITEAHREALRQAGQPIPPPVRCRFLVDTGADGSVVRHEFAERAGLKLINDNVPLHGVGVDTTGKSYMGRIVFAVESKIIDKAVHTMYIDTQIMGAKLESGLLDGLIGRDVLEHFRLTYDGKTGMLKMKYYRPAPRRP